MLFITIHENFDELFKIIHIHSIKQDITMTLRGYVFLNNRRFIEYLLLLTIVVLNHHTHTFRVIRTNFLSILTSYKKDKGSDILSKTLTKRIVK